MSTPSQPIENRLFLTNNYSIMSKYSVSKRGYFKDEILEDFIESEIGNDKNVSSRRTALVNLGYLARQLAMEWVVDRALAHEAIDCVIILGAGFDTLSLRYCSKFQCHWIEIDLPYVVEFKRKYISAKMNSSDVIISSDGNVTSFPTLNLHLVSCDLRNQNDLNQRLSLVLNNIPREERCRVAVINEVCLCYLDPMEVRMLLKTLQKHLRDAETLTMKYIGFEQVKKHKTSNFARVMTNHFDYMGFPLKNFPTEKELLKRFVNELNFLNVTIINMYQVYHNILYVRRQSIGQVSDVPEPFDEFEELDLYLSHYALVTGKWVSHSESQVNCDKSNELYDELTNRLDTIQLERPPQQSAVIVNTNIKRYGHSSCVLEDNPDSRFALVSGGFGKYSSSEANQLQHQRLNDCLLVGWNGQSNVVTLKLDADSLSESHMSLSRMHGQVCHLEDELVFFTGGRQSPQKRLNALDEPFVARINKTLLKLEFVTKPKATNSLRWRHKTLRLSRDKLIQVGGINGDLFDRNEHALGQWDLSSDKCAFYTFYSYGYEHLNRHSFGADLMDANTLLVFGGLSASEPMDHPVEASNGVCLIDLRSAQLSAFKVDFSRQTYGSEVNSINEHQFVKLGGISTSTGLPDDVVELYDLRNNNSGFPITSELLPYVEPNTGPIFIPTKMTSVHFKQTKEIMSIGGGGNLFTFGTHFNESYLKYSYTS